MVGRRIKINRFYRLNSNITGAPLVRLIDQTGKQVGIVSIQEALERARNAKLDLVEIARSADPPVVKIVDFKKFKYEEEKKERLSRRKTKEVETKEIWLSPNIGEHDFNIRLTRAREFLQGGDRVKLTVKFTGRQMAHTELGYKILERAVGNLEDIAEKDGEFKMLGRNLSVSLKPKKL